MINKISNDELMVYAMVGLVLNNGNRYVDFGKLSITTKVAAKYEDGTLGFVTIDKVFVKGAWNDLYVAFTDCESGDYADDKLVDSPIMPNFYESIFNAMYNAISHHGARILSYVDTSDNTKNPLCICSFNSNGYLEEEEEVIKQMTETFPSMEKSEAINVLNEMSHSSDGVGTFEEYEFFYEDCNIL